MSWTELDWSALDAHRERFLEGRPSAGPYWASAKDLESYDLTYGERIGWKWDAVLDELEIRGWAPPAATVLDWGCGSGIAGRRVIGRFGEGLFKELKVWDHSELASDFAGAKARAQFPGLAVSRATADTLSGSEPIGLLVVSHVLNELQPSALGELRDLVARSQAVLWTEPGSRETSRALGSLRDSWIGDFEVVAPCTHPNPCPILTDGNQRHWCHFFAPSPVGILADSNWVKFGQRAGIDLRSLPYSFIALDRLWSGGSGGLSRIIGRPEHFKPYARVLNCDADGLAELLAMKRSSPPLYKELEKTKRPLVYRWVKQGTAITSGAAAWHRDSA